MRNWSTTVVIAFTVATALLGFLLGITRFYASSSAWAEAPSQTLAVTGVTPSSAPNDLETSITITGSGFTAGLSGTVVITPPTVQLGNAILTRGWVSSTTLTTTVPAGMDPGVYTVTVTNPDGQSGSLPNAFTVTQGIGVWTTGGPYGGEVRELVQNPVTGTTIYALVHNTGVFASDDAGGHWRPILIEPWPIHLSIAPNAPGVMYYGGLFSIYRTRDGGSAWDTVTPANPWRQDFYPLAHPVSPTVVYAGGSAPLNRPVGTGEEGGIYLSTDSGSTWVTATVGLTDTHVTALAFYPDNPSRMVAGTRSGNVFSSNNAGASWTWAARVSSHIERLFINPSGAREVWAITPSPIAPTSPPYLYRSLDPGLTTWISVTVTTNPGAPEWFATVWSLTFHPTISGTIWAAAGQSFGNGFMSADGGQTWSVAGPGLPEARPGTMSFAIDRANPSIVYAGTRTFGVYKSTDGGSSWSQMNEGLAGVAPEALAVLPADANEAYAATPMGLLKTRDGGRSWQSLGVYRDGFPWRGSVLAVDPFTTTRVYLGNDCRTGPCVKIGEGGGSTWHTVSITVPNALTGWGGDTFAIAPDPARPGRLLAGVTFSPPNFDYSVPRRPLGGIYVSENYGERWSQIETSQAISGVVEFAFDPADPQVVYAATEGTGLLKSTNGGSTWQSVASWPATSNIWSVAVNPTDRSIYVHDHPSGQETTRFQVSNDGGSSWSPVTWGEGQGGLWTLRFTPPPTSTLYAGSYTGGLHRRSQDGQSWEQVRGVPETGSVYALAAGSDAQRITLYVGVSAGLGVTSTQPAALGASSRPGQADSRASTAMGAGVYRLTTTRSLPQRVYLPALFKLYRP